MDRRSASEAVVSQFPGYLRRRCSEPRPISGDETTTELPNELVFEILTLLPGRQIGRCRCVCKAWRTMIAGRPFQEIYRKRQRGLILCRSPIINRDDGKLTRRLQFFHCPLRRLKEPPESFRPLTVIDLEVRMISGPVYLTQLVDSLLCVGECDGDGAESGGALGLDLRLTLHNIGTGEKMNIPDPLACYGTHSAYHLGYDRESREYKLLRLIFGNDDTIQGAHILTLRPPSSSHISRWRVLDNDGLQIADIENSDYLLEARQCCDDGVVCWINHSLESLLQDLLCFDFSKERFRFVEFPRDGIFMKFLGLTRFNCNLALWLEQGDEDWKNSETYCYLLRDGEEEGENWSKQSIEVSRYFEGIGGSVVASGKFPGSSSSNSYMMVMSLDSVSENQLSSVYSYCWGKSDLADKEKEDEEEIFFVGELPDGASYLSDEYPFHDWNNFPNSCQDEVHCLLESNHLHLSLDHILAPASDTMS